MWHSPSVCCHDYTRWLCSEKLVMEWHGQGYFCRVFCRSFPFRPQNWVSKLIIQNDLLRFAVINLLVKLLVILHFTFTMLVVAWLPEMYRVRETCAQVQAHKAEIAQTCRQNWVCTECLLRLLFSLQYIIFVLKCLKAPLHLGHKITS